MAQQRFENVGLNPHDEAEQTLRYIRAKIDALFILAQSGQDGETSIAQLEDGTLSAYFSDLIDSCGTLQGQLDKVRRIQKAVA